MARNDDRDRVLAVRMANGANRPWAAERGREGAVRGRRAERDLLQGLPHTSLERCATRGQRKLEPLELAGEVGAQLVRGVVECAVVAHAAGIRRTVDEIECGNRL